MIIIGVVIWFIAIALILVFDYITVAKPIDYGVLGAFMLQYFLGFSLAFPLMFFYIHHSDMDDAMHK